MSNNEKITIDKKQCSKIGRAVIDDILDYCILHAQRFEDFKKNITMEES